MLYLILCYISKERTQVLQAYLEKKPSKPISEKWSTITLMDKWEINILDKRYEKVI